MDKSVVDKKMKRAFKNSMKLLMKMAKNDHSVHARFKRYSISLEMFEGGYNLARNQFQLSRDEALVQSYSFWEKHYGDVSWINDILQDDGIEDDVFSNELKKDYRNI